MALATRTSSSISVGSYSVPATPTVGEKLTSSKLDTFSNAYSSFRTHTHTWSIDQTHIRTGSLGPATSSQSNQGCSAPTDIAGGALPGDIPALNFAVGTIITRAMFHELRDAMNAIRQHRHNINTSSPQGDDDCVQSCTPSTVP